MGWDGKGIWVVVGGTGACETRRRKRRKKRRKKKRKKRKNKRKKRWKRSRKEEFFLSFD